MAAPDSAMACIMIAASVIPRPAPPYSSGMAMPSQPAAASAPCSSCGKSPLRSLSSQYASSNWRQSLRTSSRICCCSGLKEKSICPTPRCRQHYSADLDGLPTPSGIELILHPNTCGRAGLDPPQYALRQTWRDNRLDRGGDGQQPTV